MKGKQAKRPEWARTHHSKPRRASGRRERAAARRAKGRA